MEDWAVARPRLRLHLGRDIINLTFGITRWWHTLEMSSLRQTEHSTKAGALMPRFWALDSTFRPPTRGAGVILWGEKIGGKAILSTKENLISRNRVWNYKGKKGRKAERTLGFSMRKTTCERVEEMLGRKVEGICKKDIENFVRLLYTAHCWMHGSEIFL